MSNISIDELLKPDFWSMINSVKWGDKNTKVDTVRSLLMKMYPPYKTNAFKRIAEDLAQQLIAKFTSLYKNTRYTYHQLYNGVYEVVGFGQTEYKRYLNDPSLLNAIIDQCIEKRVDELFSFAIPVEDDFYIENEQHNTEDNLESTEAI